MREIDSKEHFAQLVRQYKNLVFSICLKVTGDYFAAEDLTQETFAAAYRNRHRFTGGSEKAWLCRIAHNKSIDYQRAAARRMISMPEEELPEVEDRKAADPLQLYINSETMECFKRCCEELKEPYRTIALEHFIRGMTAREIAESGGIPVKTVQTQIYRARDQLKTMLRKEELL